MSARHHFVPWVREGSGCSVLKNADTLGAGVAGHAVFPVRLRVNRSADISISLRLNGPGDVTGLDTRVVIRTDPPHMAQGFEPNYFPAIEFSQPALPWLFTGATGDGCQGRLRPWLCLVVVRKQPGVSLSADRNRPLPVLSIQPPASPLDELLDCSEPPGWELMQRRPRPRAVSAASLLGGKSRAA